MNQLTSVQCRQREAEHREVAASTTLPNVRMVALAAALAWAREAEEAEALEAGTGRRLSDEDAAIALEFAQEDGDDPDETPDGPDHDPDGNAAERRRA